MDFLTPPTDNLYKFLAIAGVAIALAAGYFDYKQLAQIAENNIQVSSELAARDVIKEIDDAELKAREKVRDARAKKLDERIGHLKEAQAQLDTLYAKLMSGKATDAEKQEFARKNDAEGETIKRLRADSEQLSSFQALDKTVDETFKIYRAESVTLATISGKSAVSENLLKQLEREQIVYIGAVIFGLIMAITGFALWYIKVQRYQDLILAAEATEKMEQVKAEQNSDDDPPELPVEGGNPATTVKAAARSPEG